jgi:hypothetical protein
LDFKVSFKERRHGEEQSKDEQQTQHAAQQEILEMNSKRSSAARNFGKFWR